MNWRDLEDDPAANYCLLCTLTLHVVSGAVFDGWDLQCNGCGTQYRRTELHALLEKENTGPPLLPFSTRTTPFFFSSYNKDRTSSSSRGLWACG